MLTLVSMADSVKNSIQEIAEYLDSGYDCHYNPKTDELVTIPNLYNGYDDDEFKLAFESDLKKIKAEKRDFIKFEVLEPFQSFKLMERFVAQITDEHFKTILSRHLQNKKPFQNFKNAIDHSEYRQDWFHFKQNELELLIEKQLNFEMDKRKNT